MFFSGSMSLKQGLELLERLGQGSWSMEEEKDSVREEWRGERGGELKRGRALIIRMTHSIEG